MVQFKRWHASVETGSGFDPMDPFIYWALVPQVCLETGAVNGSEQNTKAAQFDPV